MTIYEKKLKINLPTKYGDFLLYAYQVKGVVHLALVKGEVEKEKVPLVRIHSECMTGDVFHSLRCDCGEQLINALKTIEDHKSGILIYLRQEGRGIGLYEKLRTYRLQEEGMDTVEANIALGYEPDCRKYDIAVEILKSFGIDKVKLITNNPDKIRGLEENGIEVVERIPSAVEYNKYNINYMETKIKKMGHVINIKETN